MLLQAKKEFVICADLKPEDVFFYYTTTYVSDSLSLETLLTLVKRLDDV
jgi:hypothetical protein